MLRVPVNPRTRVPTGELGYERPVDVTAGTRALANVVNEYANYEAEQDRKRELFDVQKMIVDESNNIQQDFEDKTRVQPLGAPNFTQQVNGEYNTRHQQMVKSLRERGYSEDAVNEFEARLGIIRGQYVARAIDFQEKSRYVKTDHDAGEFAIAGSQYVGKNPNAVGSVLDEFRVALSHTDLSEPEQIAVFDKYKDTILRSAREGFAIQHPEVILGLYGFPNEAVTVQNSTTGELVNLGEAQRTVSTALTDAGFNPNVVAGFLGNFHVEGGYTGAQGDGGKSAGIAQWNKERRDNFKARFGKDPAQASIAEQAEFVVWEMQNPKAAGMTVAQRDAILKAKSPQEAAELIDKYYERSSGADRQKRIDAAVSFVSAHADKTAEALKPIPKGWKGNIEDAIQELGMTADQAQTFLETGKDTRVAPTATNIAMAEKTGVSFDETGRTGIPAIDLASGAERIQMLSLARTIWNEREADAKALERERHDAWYNNFLNSLQDGKLGQADLDAAYQNGQITDFDERQKAQNILDEKNKKNEDLARFGVMLRSGQKFNPYDKDAQKAVDAGFQKAVEFSVKSGMSADPFTIALRAWQRTGILPTQGAVMIRGGLIGTDPKQVAAAASVASNMLKQNPNAFAGVEGGEEIGKAAANYTHYVDDLGLSADEAAQKIATMNSPEYQAKIKADEPARNKFITSIVGNNAQGSARVEAVDIDKIINDQVLGKPGFASKALGAISLGYIKPPRGAFSQTQKEEARQTYLELALQAYDKNPDPEAAKAYAARQMGRFYGVEGNRIIKYPPSKAYPEIMGSRDYIYDQAKALIKSEKGVDVPTEDIFLQPTASGSTAQAFRAGKPVPYELHYITRENDQPVYHYIPGKVFVADIAQAQRDAAKKAREEERRVRRTVLLPGIGPVGE